MTYSAGSSVIFIDSQVGKAKMSLRGGISEHGIILINTEIPSENIELQGYGKKFVIEYKK